MTLNATTTKVSYNGSTSSPQSDFDVPFKFFLNSHVLAVLRDKDGVETTWTEGSQYSLTGAGNESGGTLTVSDSPTDYRPKDDETLVIKRVVPEIQGTALPLGGKFSSTTVEQMVDLLTMQIQAHSEEIARTLSVSAADPIATVVLPSVENRKSKVLAFNAAGELTTITNFGKWRGTWADSTAYVLGDVVQRDATKDLYIAVATGFTSGPDEALDIEDTTRWALAMQQPTVNFFSNSFVAVVDQTVFNLSNAPVSAAATAVYLNGVRQEPVSDYTLSGTTLTFGAPPGNGVEVLAIYGNAGAADVADLAITTSKIASDAVTLAKLEHGDQGDLLYHGPSGAPARLSAGPSGFFLQTKGGSADPVWAQQKVVQQVYLDFSSAITTTANIPLDDTIPQNTEGTEVMSAAITPTSSSNLLLVEAIALLSSSGGNNMTMALYRDSEANALSVLGGLVSGSNIITVPLRYRMVAGTTNETTFKIRISGQGGGTHTFNGSGGSRRYGATAKSSMLITELTP